MIKHHFQYNISVNECFGIQTKKNVQVNSEKEKVQISESGSFFCKQRWNAQVCKGDKIYYYRYCRFYRNKSFELHDETYKFALLVVAGVSGNLLK